MIAAVSRLTKTKGWWKVLLSCLFFYHGTAQSTSYNFRHLTVNDGLSNGVIKSIAQDKYGYMWLATASGVCLYNGYSVKVFLHSEKDSLSAPDNLPVCIVCDRDKNVWISFESGLYRYNYSKTCFELQPQTRGISVSKIIDGEKGILYCLTRTGLMLFHSADGSFIRPEVQDTSLLQRRISDIFLMKNSSLYLATDSGLVIYDPASQTAVTKIIKPITNQPIYKLAADDKNNIWMNYGPDKNLVLQTDSSFTNYHLYNDFLYGQSNMTGSQITNFFKDNNNHVWIATSRAGICQPDSSNNSFSCFLHNPQQPMSLSSNLVTTIFQDSKGFIWTGSEGYGANYFDPVNNLFHEITPDNDPAFLLSDRWYRAVTEDKDNNLWMGSMNGVLRYNDQLHTYTKWQNKKGSPDQLYSNSVRSLLYDTHGYIWIGTAEGLNRYNPSTKHMDFFTEKDSVPRSFYWSIIEDHDKNIWMGCRDGLYRFTYTSQKFEHFASDSLLSAVSRYNVTSLFEDSHQRLWMGCFSKGIVMVDRENSTVKHWMKTSENPAFISNNIRSFAEDKNGTIWIATNDGLAAYTPKEKFINYAHEQGLKTLNICALQKDDHDRLWIGSGNGLFMLDSVRKQFTSFTVKDGLPSAVFNEQCAFKTRHGDLIYPTLQGFISFRPDDYKEKKPGRNVYLSAVNVFNKKFTTATNPEELKELQLDADENFFSFELSAPDYSSPQNTWFAYRLEPFDKDWIYTKDRLITYTNVPGGNYTFHYKASADKYDWDVTEKTLAIHLATFFYRTTWFWLCILFLFLLLVYSVYRYRIQQSNKIYALQNKAQLLEKEKAVVQYENLKQQLNPHFLFNSLTSLRSLIRIDKQSAADFLDKISLNYRYILKSSESELVFVKDELAFVQTYVELQQTRFGKGLQVDIHIKEEELYKKIVPVTIQNLIDNAIKHNSLDTEEPLFLRIYTEQNYLVVSNNLQLRAYVETSNQHGLDYLVALYKHLDKRPLVIDKITTHFSVKIPLL